MVSDQMKLATVRSYLKSRLQNATTVMTTAPWKLDAFKNNP